MPLPNPGMTFTPFDPLPASELNDIVENIEALADGSGLNTGALSANPLATDADATGLGLYEIARNTLGSAGDVISLGSLPAKKYLQVRAVLNPTGGAINALLTFNSDTGNNYATKVSTDFNTGGDAVSQANIGIVATSANTSKFIVLDIHNISSISKLVIGRSIELNGTVGFAPSSREFFSKWINTAAAISTVTLTNNGAGDYAIGSELMILAKN